MFTRYPKPALRRTSLPPEISRCQASSQRGSCFSCSVSALLYLRHAGQLATKRLLELGDDGVVGDGLPTLILIDHLRLHVELLPETGAQTNHNAQPCSLCA